MIEGGVTFVARDGTKVARWFQKERVRRGELLWLGSPKQLWRVFRVEQTTFDRYRVFVEPAEPILDFEA